MGRQTPLQKEIWRPHYPGLYRSRYSLETIQTSPDGNEKIQIASIATVAKHLSQYQEPIDLPQIEKKILTLLRFDPDIAPLVKEPPTYFKGTAGFSIAPELTSYDMDYRRKDSVEVDWHFSISILHWKSPDGAGRTGKAREGNSNISLSPRAPGLNITL